MSNFEDKMNKLKIKRKVRLNEQYLRTIKLLSKKYFDSENIKIFGSRTDINKKGGDIDIYIKTNLKRKILDSKIAFLRDFELIHGDQKIDLIIHSYSSRNKKIFEIADREGVKI